MKKEIFEKAKSSILGARIIDKDDEHNLALLSIAEALNNIAENLENQ